MSGPAKICQYNKRFLDLEEKDEGIIVHFDDGSSTHADVVIGADGIRSIVKASLLGKDHPGVNAVFTNTVIYRVVVSMEEAAAVLGDERARNGTMSLGPNAAILNYPMSKGKKMNIVLTDCDVPEWKNEKWAEPGSSEEVKKRFQNFDDDAKKIVNVCYNLIISYKANEISCFAINPFRNGPCMWHPRFHFMPEDESQSWAMQPMERLPFTAKEQRRHLKMLLFYQRCWAW
jgi:2-polyprenyl-6-methoxyphenol hydroxylase-like FAD-dependent oxidoreductase